MRKKKDSHRQQRQLHNSTAPLRCFEQVRVVRPNQASIQPKLAGWLAQINSQHLYPTMDQFTGSHVHSTYCFAELAASFINVLHFARHLLDFMVQGKIT